MDELQPTTFVHTCVDSEGIHVAFRIANTDAQLIHLHPEACMFRPVEDTIKAPLESPEICKGSGFSV